jgi:HKD family nuclease
MEHLVQNDGQRTLASILRGHISQSIKIDIAVAFMNVRGLALIEPELQAALDRGCQTRLFVGTDFYLTDPQALSKLERSCRQQGASKLFLMNSGPKSVFHPKLYAFEKEDEIVVVVGSANLTGGGLENNWEACWVFPAPLSSKPHREVQTLFSQYENANCAYEATAWTIERYAAQHEAFHKRVAAAEKQAHKEIGALPKLDEPKLQAHLDEYKRDKAQREDYAKRQDDYKRAVRLLDQLASGKVTTKAQFRPIWHNLVGAAQVRGVWHSGWLYRRGHEAIQQFPEVCDMVQAIRKGHDLSPRVLFELGQQHASQIRGIGVATLTEIMNTYCPDKCAVLNKNPWTALGYFGLSSLPKPTHFSGHHYERFNDVIAYIKRLCSFDSMGQADHFLSFVYWKYAKKASQ